MDKDYSYKDLLFSIAVHLGRVADALEKQGPEHRRFRDTLERSIGDIRLMPSWCWRKHVDDEEPAEAADEAVQP